MAESAAQVRVFSDDGRCVHDPVVMRRALEYVKAFDGVIAQHAQEPRLTEGAQMHEGVVSAELGLAGWPAVAEEAIIARDVLLAEHVGSRLHVCHLSTAGSVEIIRWAKSRGIDVTAEVTPHHLMLTDELVRGYDPLFKVNPPLRTQRDVEAVREALADGTIDIVATDHAPHTREDKDCEWGAAAFGMTGLETALSRRAGDDGRHRPHRPGPTSPRVLSTAPARIGRVADHGRPIAVGEPANVTLVDPGIRRVVVPGGAGHAQRQLAVPRPRAVTAASSRRCCAAGATVHGRLGVRRDGGGPLVSREAVSTVVLALLVLVLVLGHACRVARAHPPVVRPGRPTCRVPPAELGSPMPRTRRRDLRLDHPGGGLARPGHRPRPRVCGAPLG